MHCAEDDGDSSRSQTFEHPFWGKGICNDGLRETRFPLPSLGTEIEEPQANQIEYSTHSQTHGDGEMESLGSHHDVGRAHHRHEKCGDEGDPETFLLVEQPYGHRPQGEA